MGAGYRDLGPLRFAELVEGRGFALVANGSKRYMQPRERTSYSQATHDVRYARMRARMEMGHSGGADAMLAQ